MVNPLILGTRSHIKINLLELHPPSLTHSLRVILLVSRRRCRQRKGRALVSYDFYTGSLVSSSSTGEDLVLSTLLTDVNVHVKGGTVVPMQGNLHLTVGPDNHEDFTQDYDSLAILITKVNYDWCEEDSLTVTWE
ncbi:hypothetical protein C7M84_024569 [Penaeus vannamei]|uniref:Uncharacterized protein n=1 Tax=Penaeus vannamei TaxID=6689 RepID=A0A3R7NB25_PENVA|nr:hypothetical protein C7M84_024569 [Penaeus vannamei]